MPKLLERVVDQSLENVVATWRKLEADRDAIARTFKVQLGALSDVQLDLGDPHAGGHTVSRWSFEGGTALIYKPRPVRLEGFFTELLAVIDWEAMSFRGLDVLDCGSHGWVRVIDARPCVSDGEIAVFHERLGGLLAIAYALGATDFHEENLMANGEYPVLLDLETLVTPVGSCLPDNGGLRYSVFDVGLLPGWLEGRNGQPILSGGIGGGLVDGAIASKASSTHLPRVGTALVSPFGHEERVLRGFCATWVRLCDEKTTLLELCASIRHATYRCVLRPTLQYWDAIVQALRPDALSSERDFRSALARALSDQIAIGRAPSAVLESERAGLAALDIPYFVGTLDSRMVRDSADARVVAQLPEAPWRTLKQRLASMTPECAQKEAYRIRAALVTAGARGLPPKCPGWETAIVSRSGTAIEAGCRQASDPSASSTPDALTPAACLEAARAIAAKLESMAIEDRHGGLLWLQPHFVVGMQRWQLTCTGTDFEDGLAGIAVFFAAMTRCTGERHYQRLVERILASTRFLQHGSGSQLATRVPGSRGAATGSLVYALTSCAQCLENAALLQEALTLATSPQGISAQGLGVSRGLAGVLLALLALHEAVSDASARHELLARAEAVATDMLRQRGDSAWQHGGFAHGADGVAYSLDRLANTCGWRDRPMGLNARRSPGLSPEGQSRPASVPATGEHDAARGFCHGSSGMAVARILGRGEMEHAVLFSQGDEEMELDHLCCGSSGIIDLGLELGRSVVPSLLSTSRRRAAGMLMRAASPEAYRLRLTADFQRPGLFDGLAGIGFMWLRLYDPRLPCLLLRNPWPR